MSTYADSSETVEIRCIRRASEFCSFMQPWPISDTVVRALLMIIVHILSKFLHRRYDLLCCASFSALLMLLYNPFYLFSLGFQLSYLAVFTLAFALPLAMSKIEN